MSSNELPVDGRLLGVDFGTVRVGLAISTREQNIASPLEIYQRRSDTIDAKYFLELIEENRVRGLVVGLPMHVNGTEGTSATKAREYGSWLQGLTGLPVVYWDERYTSSIAEEHMIGVDMTRKQRKRRLDMVAAQIFLQSFLDTRQRHHGDDQDHSDDANQDE